MAYEPLHHKYRPQTFAELVGQEAIASTLTNALRQQKIAPAYLFTGARGTGKTSSARILAKSLNCLSSPVPTEQPCGICEVCRAIAKGSALDVIEIDAASNTGVDNIRELIERSQFAPVQARYKVYVVDECHMLSTAAFNALLKTLEEPPDRVVFVLATTDPQRVLPTIISRCQRFDFRRIPLEAMVQHLQHIAAQEAIAITPEAIQLVGQISQGGLRDAESLLDQLSLLEGQVTSDRVWDLVGAVPERDLLALVQAIAANNPTGVIEQSRHLMDRGREPLTVLQNLASFYRDLLIAKATPDRLDLVAITPPTWAELCQFAHRLDIATILMGQQRLRESEVQVKNTTQPRLWLEVTLMGLLPSATAAELTPVARVPVPQPTPIAKPPQPLASAAPEAPQPNGNGQPKNGQPKNGQQKNSQPNGLSPAASPLEAEDISDRPLTQPDSPPEPQIPAPVAQSGFDLVQVWNELIANLQPPGTQMLLRQQGRLIAFNGQEAKVGFTSQPLFKMAIERGPNIEAAFAKIYGHKIRISLEVVAATVDQATKSQLAAPEGRSPQPITRESAAEFKATPPAQPLPERDRPSSAAMPTADQPNSEPNLAAWQTEDEVSRAAKSLAQMFNGQIVSSDSPALPGLATAELLPNPEVDLSNESDGEADDDEDVPF